MRQRLCNRLHPRPIGDSGSNRGSDVIVRPRAVPQGQLRIRSQVQATLVRPFSQPRQCVASDGRAYCGLYACSIGRHKQPGIVLAALPGPAAFVNQVMMMRTQQHQIVRTGLAPVQPVLHGDHAGIGRGCSRKRHSPGRATAEPGELPAVSSACDGRCSRIRGRRPRPSARRHKLHA